MKFVVRMMTYEDFAIEARDVDQLNEWLNMHTIEDAEKLSLRDESDRDYKDEILYETVEDEVTEFSIIEEDE